MENFVRDEKAEDETSSLIEENLMKELFSGKWVISQLRNLQSFVDKMREEFDLKYNNCTLFDFGGDGKILNYLVDTDERYPDSIYDDTHQEYMWLTPTFEIKIIRNLKSDNQAKMMELFKTRGIIVKLPEK